jgi:predicted transposase YdaD
MGTIAEVWMQRGMERSLAQGRAQGWELGKQQGKEEGKQEGRIRGLQDAVLDLLLIRFGDLPQGVATQVRGVQDGVRLQQLLREAATAVSLPTFQTYLNQNENENENNE